MQHRESEAAAMSHCLIPSKPQCSLLDRAQGRSLFVDAAIERMFRFFARWRIQIEDLDIGLFGGAEILSASSGPKSIGRANIGIAHRLIEERGLRFTLTDCGGKLGRKIVFNSSTGIVRRLILGWAPAREETVPPDRPSRGLLTALNRLP